MTVPSQRTNQEFPSDSKHQTMAAESLLCQALKWLCWEVLGNGISLCVGGVNVVGFNIILQRLIKQNKTKKQKHQIPFYRVALCVLLSAWCNCGRGILSEPVTEHSDSGVFILHLIETHSLHPGDLHFTNWGAASTNWPDLCSFKGGKYICNHLFYIVYF